jgi:hypothetical protein
MVATGPAMLRVQSRMRIPLRIPSVGMAKTFIEMNALWRRLV